ncbi:ankyrin repeat domain-containing protein [Glutamicibacter sp. BW78]|uniref:ankyrin repeat domain-containing protein n=1 Tax=Glutamicibacter sp. BW78 TaxID=2024403 RepID=UPI0018E92789|nr:ankyrin repeat domain-containing protein [Glutamicibacter sp. BW78]
MTEPANQPVPELSDEELAFLHSTFDLARQGETEKLLALIGEGLPVDLTDHKGDSLLILASYSGHNDLARGLVERGATVDRLNDQGQSALTCTVFRQNAELTRFLLEAGADPKLGPQNAWAVTDMFDLPAMRSLIEEYFPTNGA